MIKITQKDAIRLLRAVVKAKGKDYVDPGARGIGCVYTRHGQCACIVGHVLSAAGTPIRVLELLDKKSAASIDGGGWSKDSPDYTPNWLAERGTTLTPGAVKVLKTAQMYQDRGRTWGEALCAAVVR